MVSKSLLVATLRSLMVASWKSKSDFPSYLPNMVKGVVSDLKLLPNKLSSCKNTSKVSFFQMSVLLARIMPWPRGAQLRWQGFVLLSQNILKSSIFMVLSGLASFEPANESAFQISDVYF